MKLPNYCWKKIKRIKKGAVEEYKRLNPINVKFKKASFLVSALLAMRCEPAINYFLKFFVAFMLINVIFTLGYYIIGILAKPIPFINNKQLAIHGTFYGAYYIAMDEISWKFLNETWLIVLLCTVISYLGFSIFEKHSHRFIKAVAAGIVILSGCAAYTEEIIIGEYTIDGPSGAEISEEYEKYGIKNGEENFYIDKEKLNRDNDTYEVIWYGNSEDTRSIYRNARLKTEEISIGAFIEEPQGIDKLWRSVYWDTDFMRVRVNGHIYLPKGEEQVPLILVVHGNHSMEESSEFGYEYIGDYMAQLGYAVAILDENFFNGSWSGGYDDENDGRAYLTLKHIEQILQWNGEEGNIIYNKIDPEKIGLIGHSRGGETVFLSKLFTEIDDEPESYGVDFDFDFEIDAVASIGTTYGQYESLGKFPKINNVDYLAIQGSSDSDVSEFYGKKAYDNVMFTDRDFHFKSYIYIEGANHGQFNTRWGRNDNQYPLSLLINHREIMNGDEQRRIALKYLSSFFECSLKGEKENLTMFKDYTMALAAHEERRYINGYSDSSFYSLENFNAGEDNVSIKVLHSKTGNHVFGEASQVKTITLRDETKLNNKGAYLNVIRGKEYEYTIDFKKSIELGDRKNLTLDVASFSEEDLTYQMSIAVITEFGEEEIIEVHRDRPLWNNIRNNIMKTEWLNERNGEKEDSIFQTIFIPLDNLKGEEIKGIKFVFGEGEYIIDNIGLIR